MRRSFRPPTSRNGRTNSFRIPKTILHLTGRDPISPLSSFPVYPSNGGPADWTVRVAECAERLDWTAIEDFAGSPESQGATLSSVLLGAYQIVLSRFNGLESFLIGVALDGRFHSDLQHIVGPLAKAMPIGAVVDPRSKVSELAAAVESSQMQAAENHHGFDWQTFAEKRAALKHESWPILFSANEVDSIPSDGSGGWRILTTDRHFEPHDFALLTEFGSESLTFECRWDGSKFNQADVAVFADSYAALLSNV